MTTAHVLELCAALYVGIFWRRIIFAFIVLFVPSKFLVEVIKKTMEKTK